MPFLKIFGAKSKSEIDEKKKTIEQKVKEEEEKEYNEEGLDIAFEQWEETASAKPSGPIVGKSRTKPAVQSIVKKQEDKETSIKNESVSEKVETDPKKEIETIDITSEAIKEISEVEIKTEVIVDPNINKQFSPIAELALTRSVEIVYRDLEIRMEYPGETLTPDKKITQNDLAEILKKHPDVKYLDLSDCHLVGDFSLLGKLEQLEELSLCNNPQLNDISFLANLKNLKILNLGSTGIEELSPLSGLVNLQILNLKYNYLESLNPLKNLVNLHDLVLWGSAGFNDLNCLPGLTELRDLDIDSSTVKNIDVVKNFKKLDTLIMDNCRIPDISPIKDLVNLRCLTMEVKMMMPDPMFRNIENLTELRTLDLTNRGLKDISLLKNMKQLVDLQLDSNCVVDITPIAGLTKLRKLLLSGNKALRDLSCLSDLSEMRVFYIDGVAGNAATDKMKITDFSFMNKWHKMVEFGCGHNNVLKDISPFANLESLVILGMEDCIQVEDITPLRELKKLAILNISGCPRISDMSCLKNSIQLEALNFNGTNIGAYALSDLTKASGLWNLATNSASVAGKYANGSFARKRKVNNTRAAAEGKKS
jgi:Leucine-rich repeat (LRR) protein